MNTKLGFCLAGGLVLAGGLGYLGLRDTTPPPAALPGLPAPAGKPAAIPVAGPQKNRAPSWAELTAASARRATPSGAEQFLTTLLGLLEHGAPEQRRAQIEQFIAGQDVDTLRELLEDAKASPALPEDVAQPMLRRLAREDAPWTGEYLRKMPEGSFRSELLGTVMAGWGAENLPVALEWAQQLGDPALQQPALIHLSYRWFETDPEVALAYAALHPTEHRQLLTTLVNQWSREQPEAAAAWAAEFSKEPAMVNVAASAVAAWAKNDDLAAAEFVLKLPAGNLRHEAAISVMSAMAQKDPATGALWAAAFPSGPERDYAIENLVYNWAASDPASALAWSNRLTAAERDVAIFAGTGGLIETKPEVAATWVNAIQDETRRIQQSERVAQRWLQVDRWSAEFWIRSNALLPPETKQRLLASAVQGG